MLLSDRTIVICFVGTIKNPGAFYSLQHQTSVCFYLRTAILTDLFIEFLHIICFTCKYQMLLTIALCYQFCWQLCQTERLVIGF